MFEFLFNTGNFALQKASDVPILLTKNKIKAVRQLIFSIVQDLFGIKEIPGHITGYQVNLSAVLIWHTRQMRLHGKTPSRLIFNLKLDGRPFYGKLQ